MNRRLFDSLCILTVAVAFAVTAYRFKVAPLPSEHPGNYENAFKRVGFAAGDRELERLHRRFGAKHYSWHYEEWFVRDFFDDKSGGVFVDVGASHYSAGNNTFLLEMALHWNGIAIDAQEQFRADYDKNRPRTKYFTYFVSDSSAGETDLFVPGENTAVASAVRGHIDGLGLEITENLRVQEITLDDLLGREGVGQIDFLSMDIELAEPAALRGFDIERFAPKLVCIEDLHQVNNFFEDYFEKHGYAKLDLWSRIDSHNSYYAPRELARAKTP